MKQTVSLYMMERAFKEMGRETQFSYDGLKLLHEGIEEMERDMHDELEFDVVALCCDYVEMTYGEVAEQYDVDLDDCHADLEQIQEAIRDYLHDNTWILGYNDDIVVFQQF